LNNLELLDGVQNSQTALKIKDLSEKSKKIYEYPENVILKINSSLKTERIHDKEVYNLTPFTNKFKGRMITYQTHGLIVYPAKFIPQIPQFCIRTFSNTNDIILDPFCGSGTTLVEALLQQRNAYGLDINPLAQLFSRVKTTPLDLSLLSEEYANIEQLLQMNGKYSINSDLKIPIFPNLSYWFSPKVLQDLVKLQNYILNIENHAIKDFFLLLLASIIRDVSLADRDQLHPAKTKYSGKKERINVSTFEIFRKSLQRRLPTITNFSQYDFSPATTHLIGDDATKIRCPVKVDLAITSPPYVNALDYVRIHKLEAFWTNLLFPKDLAPLHRKFIGTENVYHDFYANLPNFSNDELNQLIAQVASFDKKRAGIIALYFSRMFDNLREVYRLLHPKSYYCIIIGSNNVRNVHIPTPKLLIQHAEDEIGYSNPINYSYELINKRLKIPRAKHGGSIKKEWIIVLQKL
jgi:DNA modification methylase